MTSRVTPDHIESIIIDERYFTAMDGAQSAYSSVGKSSFGEPVPESLALLTFCVLTLKNGFTVTGESTCVSAENFNADIGHRIARENAINKIWPLEGYLLKERHHQQ